MKKYIYFLPFIFIPLSLNAQNSDKFNGSLLWKISGGGLEKPSYIFGTHHVVDLSFALGYPGFNEALEEAVQVVGEINILDEIEPPTIVDKYRSMPAGVTYRSLFSEEEYRQVDDSLKKHFVIGLNVLGRFKPAMISNMLTMKITAEAMPDFDSTDRISIDRYVQEEARAKGKNVKGLETIESQLQVLFDVDPVEVQARSLLCALTTASAEKMKESATKLLEIYKRGDLYTAYETTFENPEDACPMTPEFMDAIFNKRNEKWIEQLPGIFVEGPAFVAVGMMHLAGEKGLLYQLDKLGYIVEAVN